MFKKILIANRGEIACRVMKTARAMGIKTVAVYSDADRDALHVEMADESVFIGPSPASESYLIADKIIEACKKTGAEAVHPGYGFLSERSGFVTALEKENIVFIGPTAHAIEAMGDKITSKKLAAEAGVSTVPGFMGIIESADEAVKVARDIGYPVMLKASAGGGGKGMRIAYDDAAIREGFVSAKNEARSSFGDDRVFIEKFIEQPRHIEIQILADSHGTCLYLGERECSIQRRHQKVIEEAPSPFLDEKTRQAMGEQSVALAKAVGYRSAGTVEFIVDKDRNFYFLEMNTRLQVEHPVTEEITGIDLVEAMLRVAAGEALPWAQEDIKLTGWAVESRVYAEDPYRGFLPSIGRLSRYLPPVPFEGLRIDTGVYEGAEISMFYDPMIAKLVTSGSTRAEAIARQIQALDQYHIEGIAHNIPFLSALMAHERFQEGRLTTAFIAEEYPDGFKGAPWNEKLKGPLIAASLFMHAVYESRASQIDGKSEFIKGPQHRRWVVTVNGEAVEAAIIPRHEDSIIQFEDQRVTLSTNWVPGQKIFKAKIDDQAWAMKIARTLLGFEIEVGGLKLAVRVQSEAAAKLYPLMPAKKAVDLSRFLLCPMPGLLVSLSAQVGDEVEAGQALAVVEAMKMENILRAPSKAKIKAIKAKAGDSLAVDSVIIEFEANG